MIFVDTSVWVAHTVRTDPRNERAAAALKRFRGELVTSSYVFDETVTTCAATKGGSVKAARDLGSVLMNPRDVRLVDVTPADLRRAWREFTTQPEPPPPKKKPLSLTDCTSFVVMRRLGIAHALAFDTHFVEAGFPPPPPP